MTGWTGALPGVCGECLLSSKPRMARLDWNSHYATWTSQSKPCESEWNEDKELARKKGEKMKKKKCECKGKQIWGGGGCALVITLRRHMRTSHM